MPDILLTTLNARYAHASFGLRYLMANLLELRDRAVLVEFDINQRPIDMLEAVLAQQPKIVGIGVYIWNADESLQLVSDLKRVRPDVIVVVGGPEVSYEIDQQKICELANYVIAGEADLAFADLCRQILSNRKPLLKVIQAELPEFGQIKLPYDFYNDTDIAHRVVYVEASRGCPFKCEFCLSSLDVPVRNVPLDKFLAAMQALLDRGLKQFKFVDRTFNLNLNFSKSILQFFLDRYAPGLFLHFEMIPDRLPEALRETIAQFPDGSLQFEVGVQTFDDLVSHRISRKQDNSKLTDNLTFLRDQTGVHVHADLIVGLPGEDLRQFAAGFDRLLALRPQEIQVGILKRLRGTPIVRHDAEWGMIWSPHAPYEVLQTKTMDFTTIQRMRRFSRYWDIFANSGNFPQSLPMVWVAASPFHAFLAFSDWLHEHANRTHGIALQDQARLLFEFLNGQQKYDARQIAQAIWSDYQRGGRSDRPQFLRNVLGEIPVARQPAPRGDMPRRQARHLAT